MGQNFQFMESDESVKLEFNCRCEHFISNALIQKLAMLT